MLLLVGTRTAVAHFTLQVAVPGLPSAELANGRLRLHRFKPQRRGGACHGGARGPD